MYTVLQLTPVPGYTALHAVHKLKPIARYYTVHQLKPVPGYYTVSCTPT